MTTPTQGPKLVNCTATANGGHGLYVNGDIPIEVEGFTAVANAGDGIRITANIPPEVRAEIADTVASGEIQSETDLLARFRDKLGDAGKEVYRMLSMGADLAAVLEFLGVQPAG